MKQIRIQLCLSHNDLPVSVSTMMKNMLTMGFGNASKVGNTAIFGSGMRIASLIDKGRS